MSITRQTFESDLRAFVSTIRDGVSTPDGDWTIKGFIDVYRNIYTISGDTKLVSKVLEIHLFPLLLEFAVQKGYSLVLASHQNYYPDITFVSLTDGSQKYAVDLKTTYRNPKNPNMCNGFTLGSHGEYFTNRSSRKNIEFPYAEYDGHFCLGVIYDRQATEDLDETRVYSMAKLQSISSVISNLSFFVAEKWRIASDKPGSGNTANIGSIRRIDDIMMGNGIFADLGEAWFDDYWMNYGKITTADTDGSTRVIRDLETFVKYRNGPIERIVRRRNDQPV